MTWVIGAASIMSTGAIISDSRVHFADGRSAELLQKIYPVGNYIAAGFAGSVRIGFEMIDSLKRILAMPAGIGPHAFDPVGVSAEWTPIAREVFQRAPELEKRNGAKVIMVGVSPIENMGNEAFPRVYVIRFSAPDFVPQYMNRGLRMCSIGSGAGVTQYKRSLRPLFRNGSGIHQAHLGGVHQWARTLAFGATIAVRDYPHAGISEHFHVIGITLGDMALMNNDMKTYPQEGEPVVLQMPQVATSWLEFCDLAEVRHSSGAGAVG
ncbi:hypothetical protein ACN9MZ_27335 [Pseudoduganella sp. S-14]|uniref:hypothetical protein n=1 Tax=Pseudoduganella sp. S-14 TaxID=3404065 RepID=UPI003CED1361